MSNRRARVVAPYATVKINDAVTGTPTVAGFYQGAVLPPEADPENVVNLVNRGYVEWLDAPEAKAVDKAETEETKAQEAEADKRMADAEAAAKKAEGEPKAAKSTKAEAK